MAKRLSHIERDIERLKEKISEYQQQLKELLAMLPYKSMHLSSVKDRFGIYALVDKKENRDRGIRKPRASVRKQLSETKQAASPKKAAARSKQHEMEV